MNLKSGLYQDFARNIKNNNSRIVVYGAGMIGQIVVPYIIDNYALNDYVDCYVDMDQRKKGSHIVVGAHAFEVRRPEILAKAQENTVILLTNSKFYPVIEYLDKFENLKNVDCYIVPVMQKTEQRETIPKVIHYCWFGGKDIPDFLKECMESWYKFCPDYEIKRWDENNFDVTKYLYTKQAFEHKKYGFITDVARLDILYENGGIYLDTDVTLLKPLDSLLYNRGFVGFERWGNINSGGGIGAVAYHPMIREMLDYRLRFPFIYDDESQNIETNGLYETTPFIRHGMRIDDTLQIINGMTVYPASVFHPYDYMSCDKNIEENTVSIHHFYGGWMEEEDRNNLANTQYKYLEFINRIDSSIN